MLNGLKVIGFGMVCAGLVGGAWGLVQLAWKSIRAGRIGKLGPLGNIKGRLIERSIDPQRFWFAIGEWLFFAVLLLYLAVDFYLRHAKQAFEAFESVGN